MAATKFRTVAGNKNEAMPKRNDPVRYKPEKKSRLRDSFPGQTHFPETSPRLSLATVVVLIILTIGIAAVVWWLKS